MNLETFFEKFELFADTVDAPDRHPSRDCRGPEVMDDISLSPSCDLDTGIPCRYDDLPTAIRP
ncbi:hypothetical protein [Methylococcus sp. EFPC2]|uniref:hypothetical protein n=1 Tax=Methylococcus sp. EFPC2 TaxID=2812648 RepID=UPI00196712E4|nr:hypothetical protein [Methylococcus sp. EFPC2]QSA97493.1 hypothetical protein JWZ97_01195 [Methylococcus sp. EFPC2]